MDFKGDKIGIGENLRGMMDTFTMSVTGHPWSKSSLSWKIISSIVFLSMIIGTLLTGIKSLPFDGNIIYEREDTYINSYGYGGAEACIFNPQWEKFREISRNEGVLGIDCTVESSILSGDSSSINYVIEAVNLYEIIIGDNDRRSVSLKAFKGEGSSMKPIRDAVTYKLRPSLTYAVRNDREAVVTVAHDVTGVGTLSVFISITYIPDIEGIEKVFSESFHFTFMTTQINIEEFKVGLGFLYQDKDAVNARIIKPKIEYGLSI